MADTLKEAVNSDPTPSVRLLTVVTHFDDVLAPPALVLAWVDKTLTLGRGEADAVEKSRLSLMDPRVSTDHAELVREGDAVLVRDSGSSNGTWVNGVRVEGQRRLESGDLIELGRTVLCYRETSTSLAWQLIGKKRAPGLNFGALRTFNPELGDRYRRLAKISATAQPVLIVGETGTGKVTPLGGTRTQELDVRWLAATNRQLMEEGDGFRADLLHRLAGFVIELPPLRDRREDLGLLLAHLLTAAGVKKASLHPPRGSRAGQPRAGRQRAPAAEHRSARSSRRRRGDDRSGSAGRARASRSSRWERRRGEASLRTSARQGRAPNCAHHRERKRGPGGARAEHFFTSALPLARPGGSRSGALPHRALRGLRDISSSLRPTRDERTGEPG